MSDFDDELGLPKDSPTVLLVKEDLSVHSVELLNNRLLALKEEIKRTEQAITDKASAKSSAESFFK